ncbi:solute carrier family 10 [Capsaspora owczarzaki ATCC 30864]|uniref:Solute carrier family 10 n=1 Tax=Capsaspora owczarzaki (strain ATCC 30864) TaxID=595528 RepID=A0A0D2VGM4_CAPO3|nr:solute carrier family 10 [Capsaspora owczarzaki ATCC 30864]KJE89027.1 solute carrier family 10 [Capsaspora owczarzaki ATCC 30864]|eukprot:XP_004365457.1 solute carrier family 10 [Capsaspora owczarzaki ATCC 30864]
MSSWVDGLRRNWFLVGLVVVISLARVVPWLGQTGGVLHPEYTVKYLAVMVIFFISGLSLRSEEFSQAIMQFRIHMFVQGFTFILVPSIVMVIVHFLFLFTSIDPWLLRGLLVVSCMPPPVSSAVILVKAIGGNEAASIFNSALGSLMGIFITPMLLYALVHVSSAVPFMSAVISLSISVIVPIIVGQFARRFVWKAIEPLGIPFGDISSAMLLLIIFATFCDTFSRQFIVAYGDIGTVIVMVVLGQLGLLGLVFVLSRMVVPRVVAWYYARIVPLLVAIGISRASPGSTFGPTAGPSSPALRGRLTPQVDGVNNPNDSFASEWLESIQVFSRGDIVCLLFCSTHKSLTLGIPLLKVLFGAHPQFHLVSFPLLVYHPTQILLGGLVVPMVRRWLLQRRGLGLP